MTADDPQNYADHAAVWRGEKFEEAESNRTHPLEETDAVAEREDGFTIVSEEGYGWVKSDVTAAHLLETEGRR
jgi:hypothetical protein